MSKVVPLRIPENLDELAAICARDQHVEKAAALRQWIHYGAEQYTLKLVAQGRVSIGRAAELLDVSVFDLHHLAETSSIVLGASDEQRSQARSLAAKLGK